MTKYNDLLVEIGTEELPPKALRKLAQAFSDNIEKGLKQAKLNFACTTFYASPRRLAVKVDQLASAQQDQTIERKGPAVQAAFDQEGKPSKAAMGFARSCGVEVSDLQQVETKKGAWLMFSQHQAGQTSVSLMPDIIRQALSTLPIPKRMRWGAGSEEFVRPVHWVLLLLDEQVIDTQIMGLTTSNLTRGHRFHHPDSVSIHSPSSYLEQLAETGKVYADFDMRKASIEKQVTEIAQLDGKTALIDPALLDEVCGLNEWPVAVMGDFNQDFLEIPPEALISAMQGHQKYFPVVDEDGKLCPNFITICNIDSEDFSQVKSGNERVINPRFSDAAFFWQQDLKQPLEGFIERLKTVVFQTKLGSVYDKTQRISKLADYISTELGLDNQLAQRAAQLCKCDLMTEMVGEFPNLQGIMGRYYAEKSAENPLIIPAMDELYMPRQAGGQLPCSDYGRVLAIADRIDTLIGIFAIGQKPSGVKDPFGLRRAALGVLRILIETPLDLDLKQLLNKAANNYPAELNAPESSQQVFDYMMERLNAYYTDQNIAAKTVEAVMACQPSQPSDFDQRVRAVTQFSQLAEAESLAAANKRIRNILKKSNDSLLTELSSDLFTLEAEKQLFDQMTALQQQVESLFQQRAYTHALKVLAQLKDSVDHFFDQVMVMSEDKIERITRLSLLKKLQDLFLHVADISKL